MNFEWFTGVVEDRNDPLMMNRVRVRIFGIHTQDKAKIPSKELPWATVMMPTTSSGNSGLGDSPHFLVEGSWVVGFFRDPNGKQDPIIMGSIASMPTEEAKPDKGFNDPSGTYPKSKYVGQSDVNEHARITDPELVVNKLNTRTVDVETSNSRYWSEPPTPFGPSYPYNKVFESEAGHLQEIDDSDGAERLHQYHTSGTHHEIYPEGTEVGRIVGDKYEIIYGSNFVNVKGSVNLTVDADVTTNIKGNWDVHVGKNMNVIVDGDKTEWVKGDVTTKFGDPEDSQELGVKGNVTHINHGTRTDHVKGEYKAYSIGNMDLRGAKIDLNLSDPSFTDKTIEPLDTKVEPKENEKALIGAVGTSGLLAGPGEGYIYDSLIAKGYEPDVKPVSNITVLDINPNVEVSSTEVTRDTRTLYSTAQLSTGALFPHEIVAQNGLTIEEIELNLKAVSVNILEPLAAQFPGFRINSGFRQGTSRSQHNKGMAVDIQWPSYSASQYSRVAKWVAENLPFDQLIMEHGNSIWLHISHDRTKVTQRGQTLTYHPQTTPKYQSGLKNYYA